MVLQERGILGRVEGTVGLECGESADHLHHLGVGGTDPEFRGLVGNDEGVEDVVADRGLLVGAHAAKIPHEIRQAEPKGKAVAAGKAVDLRLLDDPSVNACHIIRPDLVEIGAVVEPDEGDDRHHGDDEHEDLLILSDDGEHAVAGRGMETMLE